MKNQYTPKKSQGKQKFCKSPKFQRQGGLNLILICAHITNSKNAKIFYFFQCAAFAFPAFRCLLFKMTNIARK
jgi:hypothetical protein